MKKIVYLLVVTLLAGACSSEPHYVLTGNIEGSDSITFYLQKRVDGKTISIDSAVSKKGSFKMKGGKVDYPQLVQLVAGDTRKRTPFYLENSDITVQGTLDSLFNATFTGSKTHDEYSAYVESNKPYSSALTEIFSQYQTSKQAGDAAKIAQLQRQSDSVEKEISLNQKNFVKSNPSSYVTPSIVATLSYQMDENEIESMIAGLDTAIAALPQMTTLKERVQIMKTVAIGQKAPDFTMNDINGNPITLSSKFGAKLLLVDFWAAWCGPCRQENPNVVKVYKDFNKKGFDVFGVSLDQNKADWEKAIADDQLTWTHVSDLQYWSNAAAKIYAVNSIPANFLLDETGIIIGKNLRAEDLYNKVNDILNAKK